MNAQEPCGFPRGTIRATLALLLVGTACIYVFRNGTAPSGLMTLAGAAVAFYFSSRQQEK